MNQLDLFSAAPIMARPARPDTAMLLAMSPEYVKPAPPPEPRGIWRAGKCGSWQEMKPMQQADLQWMAHDYKHPERGGRWFFYFAPESIWRCIDPFDQMDINDKPDTPPKINSSGNLI